MLANNNTVQRRSFTTISAPFATRKRGCCRGKGLPRTSRALHVCVRGLLLWKNGKISWHGSRHTTGRAAYTWKWRQMPHTMSPFPCTRYASLFYRLAIFSWTELSAVEVPSQGPCTVSGDNVHCDFGTTDLNARRFMDASLWIHVLFFCFFGSKSRCRLVRDAF